MSATITIRQVSYVDPRSGHDKFYRTVAAENLWVAQYGRNGTSGTVTAPKQCKDRYAAAAAADKKIEEKIRKGYSDLEGATVDGHGVFELEDPTFLDRLAQDNCVPLVGTGTVSDPVAAAVAAADAPTTPTTRPDRTTELARALGAGRAAVPEDLDPSLPTRPMLASTASDEDVAMMLEDDDVLAQLKYDGDRVVIEVRDGVATALNRQGLAKVRGVGSAHTEPFTALGAGRWVFDGEVVGRTLVLFDMAAASDGTTTWVDPSTGFERRLQVLADIDEVLGLQDGASIVLAPLEDPRARPGCKASLLAATAADGREGIILRERHGSYEHGRRSRSIVKVKNVKDADLVVTGLRPDKQSAELGVTLPDGSVLPVGAASTIGKGAVRVGEVWVVTYLNVNDPQHPRLFQPRLVRPRTDKTAAECTMDQFAHAGANRAI